MHPPVDLTNLRSMTDGDAEMEALLFEEFYKAFDAGLKDLQAHCGEEGSAAWRAQAHGLKGVALNLGATDLGNLCKKAQDEHLADAAVKAPLLTQIEAEYQQVRAFLERVGK